MNTQDSIVIIKRFEANIQISDYYYSTSSDSSLEKDRNGKSGLKSNSTQTSAETFNFKENKEKEDSITKIKSACFCDPEECRKECAYCGKFDFLDSKKRASNYQLMKLEKQYLGDYGNTNKKFSKDDWEAFFSTKFKDFSDGRFIFSLQEGLSSSIRPYVWMNLANIAKIKLNYAEKFYERLISKTDSIFESSINRDLERTYFIVELSTESKRALFNILKAYSEFDDQIGYCQGINFLALQILMVIKDEENSFWLLIYLMKDRGWRNLFLPGTPKLIKLMKQFEIVIKTNLPRLHKHFRQVGITFDDLLGIFPSYFTTIFSYQVRNSFSLKVWDLFFQKDGQGIIDILTNLLALNETLILEMTFDVSALITFNRIYICF